MSAVGFLKKVLLPNGIDNGEVWEGKNFAFLSSHLSPPLRRPPDKHAACQELNLLERREGERTNGRDFEVLL